MYVTRTASWDKTTGAVRTKIEKERKKPITDEHKLQTREGERAKRGEGSECVHCITHHHKT